MTKYIIDTQLPPILKTYIQGQGLTAIHTTDFDQGHLWEDLDSVDYAIKQDLIVITKDKDFFNRFLVKGFPPKVLYLTIGNIKNNALLNLFRQHFTSINKMLLDGALLITFDGNKITEYR